MLIHGENRRTGGSSPTMIAATDSASYGEMEVDPAPYISSENGYSKRIFCVRDRYVTSTLHLDDNDCSHRHSSGIKL
jgi:hypothetical protein